MVQKSIPLIASYEAVGEMMCDNIMSGKKSRREAACMFLRELCKGVDKFNKEQGENEDG